MPAQPPFDGAVIEGVSKALGDAFTGSVIDALLDAARLSRPDVSTKWRRVHVALVEEQERTRCGNGTVVLVKLAMKPARWATDRQGFDQAKDELNITLAFAGLKVLADGRIARRSVATTHDEAAALSRRLQEETRRRGGHAEVFKYCTRDLVAEDCFSAVFEAVKGLADRIRQMTGLLTDGTRLVQDAFEGASPLLALNARRTPTELSEQVGLANIMKGIFSAFRNPAAHEPRVRWHVSEADALDLLGTLSLIHRRLDAAVLVRPAAP